VKIRNVFYNKILYEVAVKIRNVFYNKILYEVAVKIRNVFYNKILNNYFTIKFLFPYVISTPFLIIYLF